MAFTANKLLKATGADTAESINSAEALTLLGIGGTPVPSTRVVATTSPLNGGGALTGDLNLTLDTVPITKGGTGQTGATAAFDALAPTTTQGDTIYHNGTDNVRLPKGTAGQVLTMNAGATAPEWADVIDASITNAKLATMAQSTIKGRAEGAGTGAPTDLTASQVAAIIDGQDFVWTGQHSFNEELNLLEASAPINSPAPGYAQLYVNDTDHELHINSNSVDRVIATLAAVAYTIASPRRSWMGC